MATVLVVDDDPAIGRLICLVLSAEGIDVRSAQSGEEALAVLQSGLFEPDVILLDLNMEGMDGREVFRLARQAGVTSPIIFCSAFGASAARSEMGADGAIEKPFDPDRLAASIRRFTEPGWSA